ncbi:hypothetical protein [Marinimicrobium alkaliphilum]|uniref:hypothetical protein n=1 Tax=Marinimicrobium alkaliphilum TaxID=2202654 RepID=UPI001E4D351B|nr:hypothetical protein [Marinimicrobium alkaliphilum]
MMKSTLAIALSLAVLTPIAIACEEPASQPEIPDPATAVTAQMVKANNDVREYVQAMEAYIGCARMSSAQQRRRVSELEAFADEFNQAIRAFRARSDT